MADGPVSGLRVVEWAHAHLGPGAGMFLGDMGADVIHVEPRGRGDLLRSFEGLWGHRFVLDDGRRHALLEDLLRNKRSIEVDLDKPEGRDILYRLVADADVFITNFRPAAVAKHDMGYDRLRTINPRLIYAHGTSYGSQGPGKDAPGLEMMGLAEGGLMLGSAAPEAEPVYPSMGLNDRLGAIGLLVAVLSALVARERTGEGQLVHTSLLGWTVNLQAAAISYAANTGNDIRPPARGDQNDPLYNVYRLKDGTWTALGMCIHGDRYWPLLCHALDRPDLVGDARFESRALRDTHHRELIEILDEELGRLTRDDWEERVRRHDLIACRVNSLTTLQEDPQVLANDYMVKRPHPDLGQWWYTPTPIEFEKTPVSVRTEAPLLGQHTDEILAELGYSEGEIQRLREREVVASSITPEARRAPAHTLAR
jgi:crotonobetainyl-CoA:carnitine CoA-transferase CaiB-like acyl-CoA transferase